MEVPPKYRVYVCSNSHCALRGCDALLNRLDDEIWRHHLGDTVQVIVSGCLNRCETGPNLTVWPGPVRYTALTPDAVSRIVVEHLVGGVPVAELLAF